MARKILLLILLLIIGYAVYWFKFRPHAPKGPKPVPIALKKHSPAFNSSIDSVVVAYLDIKNAFVEWDTGAAKNATRRLIARLDSIPMEEMKNDTAMVLATVQQNIADIRSNAVSLLAQPNITEMRHDFNSVTQQLYPSFFKAINYEGQKLYFDECPMAFDDSIAADWISNSAEIVNPYLGKKHPKFHAGMVMCGDVKDSVEAKQK